MFDKIDKLKQKMYFPDLILDIGAHHGNWTKECLKIYPKSRYILFEPIDYPELNNSRGHPNIRVFNTLLNEINTEVDWYEMKNTGDSMFKEKSKHFTNCPSVKKNSITLNDFFKNKEGILTGCKNVLIKIDCQGSEIPILKGATDIYNMVDFIILEVPLFGQYNDNVPNFLEHIKFMDDIGFIPYEFLENHYANNFCMQVDMLFISKKHKFNEIVQNLLIK